MAAQTCDVVVTLETNTDSTSILWYNQVPTSPRKALAKLNFIIGLLIYIT